MKGNPPMPETKIDPKDVKVEVTQGELDAFKLSITELETSKQELEVKSAKLEGKLENPPVTTPPAQPPEKPKDLTKEEFAEKMVNDPMAALDHYAQTKLAPIVNEQTKNQAVANRKASELSNGDMYKNYGDEITQLENNVDQSILAQPGAYDYLVKQVRANHGDDLVAEEVKKQLELAKGGKENETDPSLSGGEANRHPLPDKKTLEETPLNEDQQRIVKGLGITDEEYREYEDPNKSLIKEEA